MNTKSFHLTRKLFIYLVLKYYMSNSSSLVMLCSFHRTVSLVKPVVKEFDDVVMQDLDSRVGSISLVKSAVQEFNDIVMKDLDSCEGDNFSGKAIPLLAELNSELLKYDRTTVAFCTDQLIHLDKMKRIVEEFKDESAMIVCHAKNCSTLMTLREDFFLSNKEWL